VIAACGASTPALGVEPTPATGLVLLSIKDGSVKGSATIGSDPVAVIVSADGAVAYVADSAPGDVYAVEVSALSVRWRAHVGGAPFGLLLAGGRLYASLFDDAAVAELDPATGAELARHTVPPGPAVLALDAMGQVVVAGRQGSITHLDGSSQPAGRGFGLAVVGGETWTADYDRAEIVRTRDDHAVGLPMLLHPFWLAPGAGNTLLIAAEGSDEDADAGGIFRFDPASEKFTTLARPRDPDQVLEAADAVFIAAHGDQDVLAIRAGHTDTWATGVAAVALAADPPRDLLVVVVNAHE